VQIAPDRSDAREDRMADDKLWLIAERRNIDDPPAATVEMRNERRFIESLRAEVFSGTR
jgi:hypothetical protein